MTDPSRIAASNPFRLDLNQQKKRAKELRRAVVAREPQALSRVAAQRPAMADEAQAFRLADAQWVIARELGLASWPALKAHVERLDKAEASIRAGAPALDRDLPTLHIRCGSDIEEAFRLAGFSGRFMEYSNPFCDGPVVADDDWLERRIRFVAHAYARWRGEGEAEVRAKLEAEEQGLRHAEGVPRVVLWFEHDSYDQLILARLLAHFAALPGRPRIELVSVDAFPGNAPFWGLGQLPPEALWTLWDERRPVTEAQFLLGARTWDALRSSDPTDLWSIAESGAEPLPFLARALFRHLRELPDAKTGLSLTQRFVLAILAEHGTLPAGRIFSYLMREHEPLPFAGDLMFWHVLHEMSRAGEPPLLIGVEGEWPQREAKLTDAGRACLEGARDYLSLVPPDRFLGGVRFAPGAPVWRWDEERRAVMRR